jgi:hypothetical protein
MILRSVKFISNPREYSKRFYSSATGGNIALIIHIASTPFILIGLEKNFLSNALVVFA